jgi:hypothetical protein
MRKTWFSGFLFLLFLAGCEKANDSISIQYKAEIVGFDPNCSTCIVSFPDDLLKVKDLAGESQDNYYQLVNVHKSDFSIGQKLLLQVREAADTELPLCIAQYPSFQYKSLYALQYRNYDNLIANDTIELSYKNCLNDPLRQTYICFDSVVSDSRCPDGVLCVWEGEATARFKFQQYSGMEVIVDLKEGTQDTLVSGYHFSFLKLLPYPKYGTEPRSEDYKAVVTIKR